MADTEENTPDTNSIHYLGRWFSARTNGSWEHRYGISIQSLDKPGWSISINLEETPSAGVSYQPICIDNGPYDWLFCKVENNLFQATCSPLRLLDAIKSFQDWVEETDAYYDEEGKIEEEDNSTEATP